MGLKLSDSHKKFYASLRFVYFGTGQFAVPALEALLDVGAKPLAIVTTPDTKVGRDQVPTPSPVKALVLNLSASDILKNTPVLQPEKLDDHFLKEIKHLKPQVCVLTDYGKIIPQALLEIPQYGFLNIHPSLLPKYRGASPVENAILSGDTKTGITIMAMDAMLDHGPIVAQRKVAIRKGDTAESLQKRLAIESASLLIHTLPLYIAGKIKPVEQKHNEATFTKLLSREDGKLSFLESAEILERKVRAFMPWPGTYVVWDSPQGEKRIKIIRASGAASLSVTSANDEMPLGMVVSLSHGAGVVTSGGILELLQVQLEGKSALRIDEFLHGTPQFVGSVLK